MARRAARRPGDVDELIGVASLAICQTVDSYDARIARLSTYVKEPVRWALQDYYKDHSRSIRIPRYLQDGFADTSKLNDAQTKLLNYECGNSEELLQTAANNSEDADERLLRRETARALRLALRRVLNKRDRVIVKLRFYRNLHYKEIGRMLHLSKQRIEQIVAASMKKLQYASECQKMRDLAYL